MHRDHKVCDDDGVCFVDMFLLSSGDDGLRE